jgi:hypothetical protein
MNWLESYEVRKLLQEIATHPLETASAMGLLFFAMAFTLSTLWTPSVPTDVTHRDVKSFFAVRANKIIFYSRLPNFVMNSRMFFNTRNQLEVFYSIVVFYSVFMMNHFMRLKKSSKSFFYHHPMFINISFASKRMRGVKDACIPVLSVNYSPLPTVIQFFFTTHLRPLLYWYSSSKLCVSHFFQSYFGITVCFPFIPGNISKWRSHRTSIALTGR